MNYLVVGGSSGIGKEVVEQLLANGHVVYTAQRSNVSGTIYLPFDAQNQEFPAAMLPEILDGVVYCPGTILLKPFHRLTKEDFIKDYMVNFLGAVSVLQACFPSLKKSAQPSVVLFSSVAAQMGMGFHSSIASAKAALEGLTKSLAVFASMLSPS